MSAKLVGIVKHPKLYESLNSRSSLADFQQFLFKQGFRFCNLPPCAPSAELLKTGQAQHAQFDCDNPSPFFSNLRPDAVVTLLSMPKALTKKSMLRTKIIYTAWRKHSAINYVIMSRDCKTAKLAAEFGISVYFGTTGSDIEDMTYRNAFKVMLSAEILSRTASPAIGFMNADIIFHDSLPLSLVAVMKQGWENWFVEGRRINLDMPAVLEENLNIGLDATKGELFVFGGIDYFIMNRDLRIDFSCFPPLLIGGVLGDTWTISFFHNSPHVATIDTSETVEAFHINHDTNRFLSATTTASLINKLIWNQLPEWVPPNGIHEGFGILSDSTAGDAHAAFLDKYDVRFANFNSFSRNGTVHFKLRQSSCNPPNAVLRFHECAWKCHTTLPGEPCFDFISRARSSRDNLSAGLNASLSLEEFQQYVFDTFPNGICPVQPCPVLSRSPAFTPTPCGTPTKCMEIIVWVKSQVVKEQPEMFGGLNTSSSLDDFQQYIFENSLWEGVCDRLPCSLLSKQTLANQETCGMSMPGHQCYDDIQWAKAQGIAEHPEQFPGLTASSSLAEIQRYFFDHQINEGICHLPPCEL